MRSKLREMYGFREAHLEKLKQTKKTELLVMLKNYFTNSGCVEMDKLKGDL